MFAVLITSTTDYGKFEASSVYDFELKQSYSLYLKLFGLCDKTTVSSQGENMHPPLRNWVLYHSTWILNPGPCFY